MFTPWTLFWPQKDETVDRLVAIRKNSRESKSAKCALENGADTFKKLLSYFQSKFCCHYIERIECKAANPFEFNLKNNNLFYQQSVDSTLYGGEFD